MLLLGVFEKSWRTCDFYAMGNDFPSGQSSIFLLLSFLYSCHQVAVRKHIRLPCNFSHFSMKRWGKKNRMEDNTELLNHQGPGCSYKDTQKIQVMPINRLSIQ